MSSIYTNSVAGPASYPTGGFTVTTTLSTVTYADIVISSPGTLIDPQYLITLDSPSSGQFKVKISRPQYTRLDSVSSVINLPSGVSLRATSGGSDDAEAAHTHTQSHTHTSITSGVMQNNSGSVLVGAAAPNASTHTHSIPNVTDSPSTGVGTSHQHTWNNVYQHQHSVTNTETDTTLAEIANATDLSATTFLVIGMDA